MDWLAGDGSKCSGSAACLPAGSWGSLEMHGLVETWGCQMLTYLLAVFFRTDSVSMLEDSSRAVKSTSLGQCLFVSARHYPDQAGCLLTGRGRSHFLSPLLDRHGHSLLSLFNCEFTTATI